MGAALLVVSALFTVGRAEAALRWELKGAARAAGLGGPVPLADGRLLVCSAPDAPPLCRLLDPVTGAQSDVPLASFAQRFVGALSLDDGKLLLPYEHALVDPLLGVTYPLPPAPRKLSELRGVPLARGRAAFVTTAVCDRVSFFMGLRAGFREVVVAPAGTCVSDVFDLGDGRVLIAREMKARHGGDFDVDFVTYDLDSQRFQLGPRLNHRVPLTAFVHRGEVVVLLQGYGQAPDGGTRSYALFIDRQMKQRKVLLFAQGTIGRQVARVDADHWLLFDLPGALLWDPTLGTLLRIPSPARSSSTFYLFQRGAAIFALLESSDLLLTLSRDAPRAPCADVVTYATTASEAYARSSPGKQVDELVSPSSVASCRVAVERARQFPEAIQGPLDTLLARAEGSATGPEQISAQILCTMLPMYSEPLIERINAANHLDHYSAALCREAADVLPVLAEAGAPGLSRVLVRQGVAKEGGKVHVVWRLQRLLEVRRDVAREAGPLLREARTQKAEGFDQLAMALCTPTATGGLARACEEVGTDREVEFRSRPPNPEHPRLLRNFGIATGIVGGLTALAYVTRMNNGGRALAIGSGVVGGATVGAVGTAALSDAGGDREGLGTVLLAAAVGLGGAVVGGAIAAHTSTDPGDARFASAAVPLGTVWLTAVGLTVHAW